MRDARGTLDRCVQSEYRSLTPVPLDPGTPWGDAEKAAWLAGTKIQRSYENEVLSKIEVLKANPAFEVQQYGALTSPPGVESARYPLFCVKTRNWDAAKPCVLVTGAICFSCKSHHIC